MRAENFPGGSTPAGGGGGSKILPPAAQIFLKKAPIIGGKSQKNR